MGPGSPDLWGFNLSRTQYESLPGQMQLFTECEGDLTTGTPEGAMPWRELFDTGRDLPGGAETNQLILWDIAQVCSTRSRSAARMD